MRTRRDTSCRHASSNFLCAASRRSRPSAGVAGPSAGFMALLVLAFGNVDFFSTRLNRRPRTTGWRAAGILGNLDGRPAATLADSSSARATCSTIWLGDHLPGARGVVHDTPARSAVAINWLVAPLHAARATLMSGINSSVQTSFAPVGGFGSATCV